MKWFLVGGIGVALVSGLYWILRAVAWDFSDPQPPIKRLNTLAGPRVWDHDHWIEDEDARRRQAFSARGPDG